MSDDLYAALGRLAHLAQGQEPDEWLPAALREAATLVGAHVLALRVTDGPTGYTDVRWPVNAAWPPARKLACWHRQVAQSVRPVRIGASDRKAAGRHGIALPIFTATGVAGVLVAASNARSFFTQAQCATLSLLMQSALARAEAVRLRAQTEVLAATDVHNRLAREIHDGPLQMLSGVLLHVRLAGRGADPRSRDALAKLDAEVRQAVTQMRALIRRLRVAHSEASLDERLRGALARLQRARGVSWTMRWREPEGLLSAQVADEIFRVINEALANVYRHSQAKHVSVVGRPHGDMFEVVVRDDGVGFDVAEALRRDIRSLSFGLVSMQERMVALGGTLTLRSQSGRGTRVTISIPVGTQAAGKSA